MSDVYEIPARSSVAKANYGVLWDQFNDINFFFEDANKENFFLNILKKNFPKLTLNKVFGLGTKKVVKENAKSNLTSKKDIYIVDLDFDDILSTRDNYPNLIYLDRYSIENYLIEENSIIEYIKEEKTTLKDEDIVEKLNIEFLMKNISDLLSELVSCFLIVNKYKLPIKYYQININRDLDLSVFPFKYRGNYISDYILEVEYLLTQKKPNLSFENQLKQAKKHFTNEKTLINFPGKYLMSLIKFKITQQFNLISHTPNESFNYRIGKNCDLHSLKFLKDRVNEFLN